MKNVIYKTSVESRCWGSEWKPIYCQVVVLAGGKEKNGLIHSRKKFLVSVLDISFLQWLVLEEKGKRWGEIDTRCCKVCHDKKKRRDKREKLERRFESVWEREREREREFKEKTGWKRERGEGNVKESQVERERERGKMCKRKRFKERGRERREKGA